MKVGYARVSREDQELGRQITALEAAGCDKIYFDKISGAKISRPELDLMLASLVAGDIVIVQKLDRFGRSMNDLLNKIEDFRVRGIGFKSLTDNFDTTSPNGRLMLHMLAAFAEFEREMIRERTKDGLRQARANGVQLGRPQKDFSQASARVKALLSSGMDRDEIMAEMGITMYKYYRLVK